MTTISEHIIGKDISVRSVLQRLDKLASDAILFLVDENQKLIGSLTDGDIRRGFINGLTLESDISSFVGKDPKYFSVNAYSISQMQEWREKNFRIIPVVDDEHNIVDIVNFRIQKSYLPIDAVIMAGGRGKRLMPLTENLPKPLIKVGSKPIVEYNIDRLRDFGMKRQVLTVNYLSDQIKNYFGDGSAKDINLTYTDEDKPLGTMGALTLIPEIYNDYVLVMNSDILTDIDFEDIFQDLIDKDGDLIVATTTHEVEIPYGVVESENELVIDIKEKPTYTYYSNAGIYIFKKELIDMLPDNQYFDATSLIDSLIQNNKKVLHYPILGYWLDIGKHQDLEKAQRDIHHLKL